MRREEINTIREIPAFATFFLDLLTIDLIDMTIPKRKDARSVSGLSKDPDDAMNKTFIRDGPLIAFAIATHNFPGDLKKIPL